MGCCPAARSAAAEILASPYAPFSAASRVVIPYFVKRLARGFARRVARLWPAPTERYLGRCESIIHVGANHGAERETYARRRLRVLWVEASPEIFAMLESNLRPYPEQTAIQALLTDTEGTEHVFHLANNGGQSSSIFDLAAHRSLWPDVHYTGTVTLRSRTLAGVLRDAAYKPGAFDALILDVQGAELLVLKGAGEWLDHFRYIQAEAADFEAYRGAGTLAEITAFLKARGFEATHRVRFAGRAGLGHYYDVVFKNVRPRRRHAPAS